jgi:hypothetical protein
MAGETYKLTSPPMRGDGVEAFQRAMKSKNFYVGKIDGICGELTVQGFYRSKYWLGYPKPDHAGGDVLYSYLTDKKKPNVAMRQLTKRRRKIQNKTKAMRQRALDEAIKHLETKESPAGSNKVRFSRWYGLIGPWCAMFATWNFTQAGSKVFKRGSRYAYVPFIVSDARRGINNLTITRAPEPGDLVCFDWQGDGVADHVGHFEMWFTRGQEFSAIEGNTAVGNDSNGGEVMRRRRNMRNVQAFVHVGR